MPNFICITCGTQFPASETPPPSCPICEDERQYINPDGQQWTTLETLRTDHTNTVTEVEPGVYAIRTDPLYAIAQQAYLIRSPEGNVLWDCISFIDDATVQAVNALGGITAIAISHPHFYSSMIEWSRAFGDIPIYLHTDNRQYVMRSDPVVHFWEGETHSLNSKITLVRCGGHFDGSTVLHWADGAEGKGSLFTGDTIYLVSDRRFVTFMYSYPNLLPMSASKVRRIANAVKPYAFERIYAAWPERVMLANGHERVQVSAERYIRLITD